MNLITIIMTIIKKTQMSLYKEIIIKYKDLIDEYYIYFENIFIKKYSNEGHEIVKSNKFNIIYLTLYYLTIKKNNYRKYKIY